MAAADLQFHVLAVDDSLIDRKLIERLFRISSCQGKLLFCVFISRIVVRWIRYYIFS